MARPNPGDQWCGSIEDNSMYGSFRDWTPSQKRVQWPRKRWDEDIRYNAGTNSNEKVKDKDQRQEVEEA